MAFLRAAEILVLLALASIQSRADAAIPLAEFEAGVCFGMKGDNLPPPSTVVALYQKYSIKNMRLFEPNIDVLTALKGTEIQVTLGVRNEDLSRLAADMAATEQWYKTYVAAFPDVHIIYITVGNEVIPGQFAQNVVPVMNNLQSIISRVGSNIGVSTVVPMTILASSYPPSSGAFTDESVGVMEEVLKFLLTNKYSLFLNVYPYFPYAAEPGKVRLDYAQFTASGPVVEDQGYKYWNLLYAMVDAVNAAAERVLINATLVNILVSESGWPSAANGEFTTPDLASTYNKNLWKYLTKATGTPRRPFGTLTGYIFAMFNEDLKPAGVEQHWGIFNLDGSPAYPVFN